MISQISEQSAISKKDGKELIETAFKKTVAIAKASYGMNCN